MSSKAFTTGRSLRDGRGSITNSHMASSAPRDRRQIERTDSLARVPLLEPSAGGAGAAGDALPRLVSLPDCVLPRDGIPIPEQPDQHRTGHEPTDMCPEGDSTN